jgi:type II secretory pathway predicted ATPase ExeA
MTGAAGVGKTTLTSAALRTTTTRLALGWLNDAPVNAMELLELLLAEFGFNAHRVGRVERQQMWRQFLNEMSATESRVFVIAERSEDIAPEVLRALESLTAADPNGCPGANLVLLGQPTFNEQLKAPALESLRQRIRLRQRLEPFTPEELLAYLKHRVSLAGGSFEKIFAPDSLAALHQYTGGIPRIVNNLCETALTLAATRHEQQLTAPLVTRIAVGLFGLEPIGTGLSAAAPAAEANAQPNPQPAANAMAAPVRADLSATANTSPAPTPAAAPTVAISQKTAPTETLPEAIARWSGASGRPPPATPRVASAPLVPTAAATLGIEPAVPRSTATLAKTDDESFTFTATDIPEVPMADFPVLMDAVDSVDAEQGQKNHSVTRAATTPIIQPPRQEQPRGKSTLSSAAPAAATMSSSPATPAASVAGKPSAPFAPQAVAKPGASTLPPPSAKPTAPSAPPAVNETAAEPTEDELLHQTQTMRALAVAKSIDDISNSMAETLFGDADLDMLSAALASAGWGDDDDDPKVSDNTTATKATAKTESATDKFALFDLGPSAPLELAEDLPSPPDNRARKTASTR